MKTRVLSVALAAALAGSLMLAQPAAAITVFDPSNFVQNTLTAVRTLEMIQNQVSQLQNQAQMLVNQAKHLQSLDYNSLSVLLNALSKSNALLAQAQGLTFEVAQAQATFTRLYGTSYTTSTSSAQMLADAKERWTQTQAALTTATQMQSQVAQNLLDDQDTLTTLVNQSQSAVGELQATQATNQLLALLIRQLIQAQQLQVTQGRASALEEARRAAAETRGQAIRERFYGSGTTPYTSQSVNFYND